MTNIFSKLQTKNHYVLLDTHKKDESNHQSYLFLEPEKIIETYTPEEVPEKINEIETEIQKGYYAAGFLSYEAGYALEKTFEPFATEIRESRLPQNFPLLKFGIYKKPLIFEPIASKPDHPGRHSPKIQNFHYEITKPEYLQKAQKIKKKIDHGETYETNFTFKTLFDYEGDYLELYQHLRQKQKVSYGSLLKFDDVKILSFSPELFFRIKEGKITMKPMKGTIARGKNVEKDEQLKSELKNCSKNRAENTMIVDLIRNDLGRIAQTSSVLVEKLCEIETYETVHQMTSTISAQIKPDIPLLQILKSIFPCGSITGAPKIRTMQIIHELESSPRSIYCGAIGFLSQKESVFSVPIRTVSLQNLNKNIIQKYKGEMGIGGAITYDSDPEKEYKEALLKAKFLTG